jgi:hypothetical protein
LTQNTYRKDFSFVTLLGGMATGMVLWGLINPLAASVSLALAFPYPIIAGFCGAAATVVWWSIRNKRRNNSEGRHCLSHTLIEVIRLAVLFLASAMVTSSLVFILQWGQSR